MDICEILSKEFSMSKVYANNIITLIDDGNTVPFIARYRKEMTGSCDDQVLREFSERLNYLRNLEKRKEEIIGSITEQEKMTDELLVQINEAQTLAALEDIYRPYKQKRRTRATVAKERGLEPLANIIFAQSMTSGDIYDVAKEYIDEEKGVANEQEAIDGAKDIIAETVSDSADARGILRNLFNKTALLTSVSAKDEQSVYEMYYDYTEPIGKVAPHRILAINRGEKEGILKPAITLAGNEGAALVCRAALKPTMHVSAFVRAAAEDAYERLIFPSIQREIRSDLTERAGAGAIHNFALNLKPLLMQPPVKGFVTMGLDPGYRNGCKVAVVDPTGKVLATSVVYPTFSERKKQEAIDTLSALMTRHKVQHIAIGNGTASRETEAMTVELLKKHPDASYMIVSEAGASVYSASPLAAEEFPEYDVNLRSAVSIARRLQDPLAELVKIDPKAIGVGQYQHDCPQKELDAALGAVVEDCVNAVGVDVNTASRSLLQQISGLTATTAKNIVVYREENGPFTSRAQLKKVPKLGPKAFEQSAGFLRVPESKELLDNTGIHPESYQAARDLLSILGYSKGESFAALSEKLTAYGAAKAAAECGVGEPTLLDIAKELAKPGRDPRDDLTAPILRKDVLEMKDLKPGMELTGTVRNVIDFGVFVDIGVHQDGLVHISQVANRRLRHPSEAVKVGDVVNVVVLDVDEKRHRISLSMKQAKQN